MAACTVTFTLTAFTGSADATNTYTLQYRQSGTGQYGSSGVMYADGWRSLDIGGTGSAQAVSLEQGEYYDFKFPQGGRSWNHCLCPASASATLNTLLATAS